MMSNFTWTGFWDNGTAYQTNTFVTYENVVYVSLSPNISSTPSSGNTDWDIVVYGEGSSYIERTPLPTVTPTPTDTPSVTPTSTETPTPTPTITQTETPTHTPVGTQTPTPSVSAEVTSTPTETPTVTPTNTPTETPIPTSSETPTVTPTNTPTNTETPTNTPTPTETEVLTPTETPTNTPTPTNTETPTNTPTPEPTTTPTNTETPTQTQTPSITATPTQTSSETPTNTPTNTETPTNTPTNTETPTNTPTNTLTPTQTPSPTPYTPLAGSLQFNGTNSLRISPGLTFFNEELTVEGWFYNTGVDFNNIAFFGNTGNTSFALNIFFTNDTTVSIQSASITKRNYTTSTPITVNEWHYLIFNRQQVGVTINEAVYIDGVRAGAKAGSTSFSNVSNAIGASYYGANFPGFLTNVRITSGSAVYSNDSTTQATPRAPLTVVTNTRYLMLGAVVTTDSSGTQTVTNINSVAQSSFTPFTGGPAPTQTATPSQTPTNTATPSETPTRTPTQTPTVTIGLTPTATQTPTNTRTQTPTTTTTPTQTRTPTPTPTPYVSLAGSLQFDGTNSLLLSPGATFGAGAFTVEGWFYNTADFILKGILGSSGITPTTNYFVLYFLDDFTVVAGSVSGDVFLYTPSVPTTTNEWHYLIYNRNAGTNVSALYIDGVRAGGTQTDATNYSNVTNGVGLLNDDTIYNFYGNLTNLRVRIGTATYNSTLTTQATPRAPLTSLANTKYLMLGAAVTTDSSGTQTVTNVNSVTQVSTKPFTPPANPPY